MLSGRKRWVVYALAGLVFGVFDWYYLDWLAHFPWGDLGNSPLIIPVIIALNYGIWLVPVLPITIYESRLSRSAIRSAMAGALCWTASIQSYYTWYTLLLLFRGLPNLEHHLLLGERQADYWQELSRIFQMIILDQVIEWIPMALIGGSLVGLVAYRVVTHKKPVELVETVAP